VIDGEDFAIKVDRQRDSDREPRFVASRLGRRYANAKVPSFREIK
jgi:hypothetical protein